MRWFYFTSTGKVNASDIYVYSRNQDAGKSLGCTSLKFDDDSTPNIPSSLANSYVTAFVCVKPDQFPNIVKPIISCMQKCSRGCIVSVMAGITLQTMKNEFSSLEKFSVARTIPNLAVEFGKGVWAWTSTAKSDCPGLQELLDRISFAPFVAEKDINVVCALSGSGIAYVSLLFITVVSMLKLIEINAKFFPQLIAIAEAMKTSAVFNGMNVNLAREIIQATMIGCGTLLKSGEVDHPSQLIDQISSPGGTTIYGLAELQKANVYDGISNAINATVRRAKELSNIPQDDSKQLGGKR